MDSISQNGFMNYVITKKVFNKEIFHKIGTIFDNIGGCYKTNKSLIRWASIKRDR